MSRWTAPAECYLVDNDTRPLAGPFSRSTPLIALIDRLYHQSGRVFAYGNASRYRLAKERFFPGTKAGDAALKAALRCPDLEQRVLPLLGPLRPVLGGGYDQADWAAIDALLAEYGILPGGAVDLPTPAESGA